MGRTLGSKNKPKFFGGKSDPGVKNPEPSIKTVAVTQEPKQTEWTALEWKVADELHQMCSIPGCIPRVHLIQARRIVELVNQNG